MSGLYLQIQGVNLPENTIRVSGRAIKPMQYNRFIIAHQHEFSVEGYLYASGPGNLSAAMFLLEAAIRQVNPIVSLVSTVSGATQHTMLPTGSIGGVVLENFAYTDTPLSMATQVKFTASWSAIYGTSIGGRTLVSLTETVRIQGDGGPDDVLAPQAGLKSIYQRIADYTDVIITQSGKITSIAPNPSIPAPLITTPGAKVSRGSTIEKSVKQFGTTILLYEQGYSYTFQLPEMPVGPINPTVLS